MKEGQPALRPLGEPGQQKTPEKPIPLLLFAGNTPAAELHPFEVWLEGDIGRQVWYRIMNNKHAVTMDRLAAYFDTVQDVQQKALIWLWERWDQDPDYTHLTRYAADPDHAAGIITKNAVLRARCRYAKRRREGREQQVDLFFRDGNERFIPYHDRPVAHCDRRTDIHDAIETVVRRMAADQTRYRTGVNSKDQLNQRYARIPIEHITRTIIEGYMYHYTDRYSQTGTFRKFCEARGVSRNQIARWRPTIMAYLRQALADYAPPSAPTPIPDDNKSVEQIIVPIEKLSVVPTTTQERHPTNQPREVVIYAAQPTPPGLFAVLYHAPVRSAAAETGQNLLG
ncbi:MAG: hypothetical protein KJ064_17790 [Anaerolineae bacterium]|nr:hypothetical protein [Anaerolineae bacterium]